MSTNDIDHNLSRVEALSRLPQITARSEKRTRAQGAFPVLLLGVFFVALLGALIAGVTVYRNISGIQEQNVARREGLELISNIVRANDAKGAIATSEGHGVQDVLVLLFARASLRHHRPRHLRGRPPLS